MFGAAINIQKNCIEEGTLNATETAVYNSFENLLVLQTLIFFPIITRAEHRFTLPFNACSSLVL